MSTFNHFTATVLIASRVVCTVIQSLVCKVAAAIASCFSRVQSVFLRSTPSVVGLVRSNPSALGWPQPVATPLAEKKWDDDLQLKARAEERVRPAELTSEELNQVLEKFKSNRSRYNLNVVDTLAIDKMLERVMRVAVNDVLKARTHEKC